MCCGPAGYQAAQELFRDTGLIRPYAGDDLTRLYIRRSKYMAGGDFDALIQQEQRKLQGLTPHADAHINCEPIRSDDDRTFARMSAKEIGEMTLLATITDDAQDLATPALYQPGGAAGADRPCREEPEGSLIARKSAAQQQPPSIGTVGSRVLDAAIPAEVDDVLRSFRVGINVGRQAPEK